MGSVRLRKHSNRDPRTRFFGIRRRYDGPETCEELGELGMRTAPWLLRMVFLCASAQGAVLPDAVKTPGAVFQRVTATQVCRRGYAKRVRHVTAAEKRWVRAQYGLSYAHDGYCAKGCEIDHLVSLELGGSNAPANLWPEPYHGPWNAHIKDRYENFLHRQVCRHHMTLRQAQQAISRNWIEGYRASGLSVKRYRTARRRAR